MHAGKDRAYQHRAPLSFWDQLAQCCFILKCLVRFQLSCTCFSSNWNLILIKALGWISTNYFRLPFPRPLTTSITQCCQGLWANTKIKGWEWSTYLCLYIHWWFLSLLGSFYLCMYHKIQKPLTCWQEYEVCEQNKYGKLEEALEVLLMIHLKVYVLLTLPIPWGPRAQCEDCCDGFSCCYSRKGASCSFIQWPALSAGITAVMGGGPGDISQSHTRTGSSLMLRAFVIVFLEGRCVL